MLFLLVNMLNINVFVYTSSKLFSILKTCQLNSYKHILNYSAMF